MVILVLGRCSIAVAADENSGQLSLDHPKTNYKVKTATRYRTWFCD
jgi:hypothetical protein